MKKLVADCTGFDWDEGNSEKNWNLHEVTDGECEEVFFHVPLLLLDDLRHSQKEKRAFALGRTSANRWLLVAFTIRNNRIRVISVREMNDQEERKYDERVKTHARLSKRR